ncbi:hypothetical protein BCR44DRAFT_75683 [Catenaria anguillulae PL171]|uniref:CCHC-type domain-containing protein n=1 Tax=Catenaria anguillulae PL171 TaxID=765915 RepID=A0A1Y2H5R3_9FUNG|nr:hypothetical protein BCR44DRAFT_75683 [Catenaria anguillulae PL171]
MEQDLQVFVIPHLKLKLTVTREHRMPRFALWGGSARLCYSCGESGHVKLACPSRPIARSPSAGPAPVFAPVTSAGGICYTEAAKQAINKVDQVDKVLRSQVADHAGQMLTMQETLNKYCAQQDVLLSAIKVEQDKMRGDLSAAIKKVEKVEERLESLASSVQGLLTDFETLSTKFELMSGDNEGGGGRFEGPPG